METALLRLEGVCVTYPGPPPVAALTEVTAALRAGERIVVTGPSGSGKSTLLNVLGLLEKPTQGALFCNGVDVTSLGDRQTARLRAELLGFVFQSFHLVPSRTALQNVALPMAVQGVPRHERMRRAESMLERVGMSHRARALGSHLSGGERQRVAIARALTGSPGILLCDEPTGNLDSQSSEHIMTLLSELSEAGTTVVLVTHETQWRTWGHRLFTVADGRVTLDEEART